MRDVLLQYAQAAKLGWSMLRAGQVVQDPTLGVAVVGTAIQMRYPRTSTSRRPQVFNLMSTTGALAWSTTGAPSQPLGPAGTTA